MRCNVVLSFIVQALQDQPLYSSTVLSTASTQADSVPVLESGGGGDVLFCNFPNDLLPGLFDGLLGHEGTQLLLHPPELKEVR
jgi:hypothetical protein